MRILLVLIVLLGFGCEDPVVVGPARRPVRPSNAGGPPPPPPPPPGEAPPPGPTGPRFADEDFVEVDLQNRDPFRSFAFQLDGTTTPVVVSRYVKMGDLAIDDMRLIAIVTGGARPYAMVLDNQGMGHVIEVRDYIGRPEIVQTGGTESMPIQLNWRVDRIRDGEVVLAREDPTAPNQPPVFRTMQLHPEGEAASRRGIVTGPSTASDPTSGPSLPPASGTPGFRLTITPPEQQTPAPRR
jgi:hypothetical protein